MAVYSIDGRKIDDGLSDDAKEALLNSFAHNAWADQNGQTYNNTLREALYADNIDRITAALSLGNHKVYSTDNIESLRNFLTVTAYYSDGTHEEVFDYALSGDISSIGTKTITVAYNVSNTATVSVDVVANTTGILYEWDFTKGLTDLRQGKTGRLVCHKDSENAIISQQGLEFNKYGQGIVLLQYDEFSIEQLKDKTIQVDVVSFEPQYTNNAHTRFIMFKNSAGQWDSGVVYYGRTGQVNGWDVYTGTGWGNHSDWNLSARNAISGKEVGLYIDSSLHPELIIDGATKGKLSQSFSSTLLVGLMIGNNDPASNGATLYNAVIAGVRIFDGRVL